MADQVHTSQEVINNLLRKKSVDRVGAYEIFWHYTLKKWVEQGYPTDQENKPVDPVSHFKLDMRRTGGGFRVSPLLIPDEIIEETDEWIIKRNGAGAALKGWTHTAGTPEHIDFRMTSREVWERDCRPHLLEVNPERINVEEATKALAANLTEKRWSFYGNLFVWENMRQSMGDICLYESLLLDPGWIHDYNRVYTDFFKAHFKLLFDKAGLPNGIWIFEDMGYRDRLFCSPKTYAELIFPYSRELVEFLHSYGLAVVLHSCGNITGVMDQIVDAGFDALNPMEVKAGCDIMDFARRYGDRLVLVGGFDVRILESNDRRLIGQKVGEHVDKMKSLGARYVFGSDHSITTNVDYDSYRYALDVCREHMNY